MIETAIPTPSTRCGPAKAAEYSNAACRINGKTTAPRSQVATAAPCACPSPAFDHRVRQKCAANPPYRSAVARYARIVQFIRLDSGCLVLKTRRVPADYTAQPQPPLVQIMFDTLTNRLAGVFKTLRGEARLTEAN